MIIIDTLIMIIIDTYRLKYQNCCFTRLKLEFFFYLNAHNSRNGRIETVDLHCKPHLILCLYLLQVLSYRKKIDWFWQRQWIKLCKRFNRSYCFSSNEHHPLLLLAHSVFMTYCNWLVLSSFCQENTNNTMWPFYFN